MNEIDGKPVNTLGKPTGKPRIFEFMPDPSDKSRPWKHWAPSEWKAMGSRFPAFMVIPQPSFPNRRSLEGAKDPSILCAAPGEKNLKMFVKQMCVTRMMFFQLGSLVHEYFFQVALSRLSL